MGLTPHNAEVVFDYFLMKKTVTAQILDCIKRIAKLLAKYHANARARLCQMPGDAAANNIGGSREHEDEP